MESEANQDLRAQIIALQNERDHWKNQAEHQQESQLPIDSPALKLMESSESKDEVAADKETENLGKTDAETEMTGHLGLPIQTDAVVKQTDRTASELASMDRNIHPSIAEDTQTNLPLSKFDDSHAERVISSPINATGTSVSETYDFMDDFPKGVWWTSLDEDDGCSRSLDFGVNGFTASLNIGHEILQITAPHSKYGVVSIRGSFADNPDAILARAQRNIGGKSTFGLKWAGNDPFSYNRSARIEHHELLNFRWPYKKHALYCPGLFPGTVSSLSFLKDDMVYQILRFKPGPMQRPQVRLPLNAAELAFSPLSPRQQPQLLPETTPISTDGPSREDPWNRSCRVEFGGMIRLYQHFYTSLKPQYVTRLRDNTLSCNIPQQGLRLSFELFSNGEKKALSFVPPVEDHGLEVNMMTEASFKLEPGSVTTLIGRISLRQESDTLSNVPLPSNDELAEYLGASETSENATDRVWASRIDMNADIDEDDFCTSAACLEQILGVTSVPMRHFWRPLHSARKPPHSSASSVDVDADSNLPSTKPNCDGQTSVINLVKDNEIELVVLPMDGKTSVSAGQTKTDAGLPSAPPRVWPVSADSDIKAIDENVAHSQNESGSTSDEPVLDLTADRSDLEAAAIRPSLSLDTATAPSTAIQQENESSTGYKLFAHEQGYTSDTSLDSFPIMAVKAEVLAMDDPNMGIALLTGILGNQFVDVQKSFWQIRYLVKAHNFLALQSETLFLEYNKETSTYEEPRGLASARTAHLDRIKFHIHHCLVWMAKVVLPVGRHTLPAVKPYARFNLRVPGCDDTENDRTLYPPLAIWYVIKNCPEALPPVFMAILADSIHNLKSQDIGDFDVTSSDHPPKLAILMWYRHACLARIMEHLRKVSKKPQFNPDLVDNAAIIFQFEFNELIDKSNAWHSKAEKSMASFRRAALDSYSDQDESTDRLSFLGVELGFVKDHDVKRPNSCLAQTRRRILDRRPTVYLNPGAPLFGQDGSANIPTTAPWELTCTNHHIRLQLFKDPEMEDEVYSTRKDCLRYKSINWLFVGSWDTSNPNFTASFWDMEISSMVCATLLDMRNRSGSSGLALDAVHPAPNDVEPPRPLSRRPSAVITSEVAPDGHHAEADRAGPRTKRDFAEDTMTDLLRKQLEMQDNMIRTLTKQGDNAFEFEWTRCEPHDPFHPDEWIQSLDDTPDLFRPSHTQTVHLRVGVEAYLNGVGAGTSDSDASIPYRISSMPAHPDWTKGNMFQKFIPHEVVYISLYDIGLRYNEYRKQRTIGRLEALMDVYSGESALPRSEVWKFFELNRSDLDEGIWAAYLDGCFCDTGPKFERLPDTLKRRFRQLAPQAQSNISDKTRLLSVRTRMQDKLLNRLSDSLVDLDTRHRIFFVQRCSRSTVEAFIYMWHRQSIDTFDAYFQNTSIFSDTADESWISTITLSYWRFMTRKNSTSDIYYEPRDTAPFPPKAVSRWHSFKATKRDKPISTPRNKAKHIIEGSSSVVISGDSTGRWWTCSVISSILPTPKMRNTSDNATRLLRDFAHQPSSGRCLIFLCVLGVLCVHIAMEYEEILEELTRAINLGREVLKKGLDWTHAEDAIQRLKSMLWALEALRIFDDTLGQSLDAVKNAKERMHVYLRNGPGRRHDKLEQHCKMLLEKFDREHGRLISVHLKIEQKINQISRYREGISAVSNLEDTHTALKQNDTIRILTYITIAYLPLSFIAAIFSMSIVTESNWGPNLFGGLIIIFFVSTLVLAKSLGLIIRTWDSLVKTIRTKLGIFDPLDLEDLMDQAEKEVENEREGTESDEERGTGETAAGAKKGPMDFVRKLRHRKNASRKDPVDTLA